VLISSVTGEGLDGLLERVAVAIPRFPVTITVLLPLERGDLLALLHREAEVLFEEPRDDGVLLRARVEQRVFAAIRDHAVEGDRSAAPTAGS
jgi:GTP-binding protein HflX